MTDEDDQSETNETKTVTFENVEFHSLQIVGNHQPNLFVAVYCVNTSTLTALPILSTVFRRINTLGADAKHVT